MVRKKPLPFPPEPFAWAGIALTQWSLARADAHGGRRNLWLRAHGPARPGLRQLNGRRCQVIQFTPSGGPNPRNARPRALLSPVERTDQPAGAHGETGGVHHRHWGRRAAVEWLASVAPDPDACRWEWERNPLGVALLPAGRPGTS